MIRSALMAIVLIISGCSNSLRTIGIVNHTADEITIETKPNLRYNGLPEKYIGIEKDSSNRGIARKFGHINAIVIYPLGPESQDDSVGKYIMKP